MKFTPAIIYRHFIHMQTNLVAAKVAHDVKEVLLKHRPNNLTIALTVVFSIWFSTMGNAEAGGKLLITSSTKYKDMNELLEVEEVKTYLANRNKHEDSKRPIDGDQPVIKISKYQTSKEQIFKPEGEPEFMQLVSNLNR